MEMENQKGDSMKKILRGMLLSSACTLLFGGQAFANIRNLEINADMDSVSNVAAAAGTAFRPDFTIEDEDAEMLDIRFEPMDEQNQNNPTIPYTLKFRIVAEEDVLDDDLKIRGRGFRASYVDFVSVDNTEAEGRLMVYPFYQLKAPANVQVDAGSGKLCWTAMDDYAGAYELVLSYTKKNGEKVTVHRRTKDTELKVSSYLNLSSDGSLAAAVRALPTEEIGYERASLDRTSGEASWSGFGGAESYRVQVRWTDRNGKEQKREETVKGSSKNVSTYIRADKDGNPRVLVRAVPKSNDSRFYNIAISDWSRGGTGIADTSDYEIDDIWEMLSDYQGVTDGAFASLRNQGSSFGSPTGSENGYWNRVGYRWQYVVEGGAYNLGWKKLNNDWYYFDSDGFMHTGWLTLGEKRYYLTETIGAETGIMVTGNQSIKGQSYLFDESGELVG